MASSLSERQMGEWRCEEHPEREWPHDDCLGPGMLWFYPHVHFFKAGLCETCRMTRREVLTAGVTAVRR